MIMEVKLIILFFLFVCHCLIIWMINKKNGFTGLFSSVLLCLILYFDCIPFITHLLYYLGRESLSFTSRMISICESRMEDFLYAVFSIVVFTLAFVASYYYKINKHRRLFRCNYHSERIEKKILKAVTIGSFSLGSVCFLLFIHEFGGIAKLLASSEYLRSFNTNASSVVGYYASLMIVPARLITVTPIFALSLLYDKSYLTKKARSFYIIVLIISIFLSIIFYLFNAGKTGIGLFAIIMFVAFVQDKVNHPWRIVLYFAVAALPILGILDSLFVYISYGRWDSVSLTYSSYLSPFTYPFFNVLNLRNMTNMFGYRWGQDYVTGLINLIPGVEFPPSYEVTSEFAGGVSWRILGGVPDDIITFGYLQLSFLGVVFAAIVLAFVCSVIDKKIPILPKRYYIVLVSCMANIFMYTVNADITVLFSSQFQLVFSYLILMFANTKQTEDYQNQVVSIQRKQVPLYR